MSTIDPTPQAPEPQGEGQPPPLDGRAERRGRSEATAPERSPTVEGSTESGPLPPPKPSNAGGRRLERKDEAADRTFTPRERLQILDLWLRSGLTAGEFAPLVGASKHTLYAWKKRFEEHGPAGLEDGKRGGPSGSRLDDLTKRTILLIKKEHPDYGCERISAMLYRGPALAASPGAVGRVLKEAGYELVETPTQPHEPPVKRFERAKPNQLWQTDLFTFLLKRQNQRVYLVAFMDDHSRFVTGFGLHASQSTALTLEVLRAAIGGYGSPEEILTDNGAQYVTWRGKSAFTKELEKRGIKQIVARPRHPQTLGKIERFWGSLWRECLETAIFRDLADARARIAHFIDHYNFQRPHQAIENLVPADRFFGAAAEVKRALAARVAANALELAKAGAKPSAFYLTGQIGGKPVSVHAAGEQIFLLREDGRREEVALVPPDAAPAPALEPLPPAVCPDGSPGEHSVTGDPEPERGPGESPLDGAFTPEDVERLDGEEV